MENGFTEESFMAEMGSWWRTFVGRRESRGKGQAEGFAIVGGGDGKPVSNRTHGVITTLRRANFFVSDVGVTVSVTVSVPAPLMTVTGPTVPVSGTG